MQCKKLITSSRLKGECHICGNGITRNKYCESGHDGDFHCDDDDDNDNDHNDEWLEASKVCLPNRAELQCLCSFTIMIRVPAVIMMIVFLIKCLSNRAELRFLCRTTSPLIGRICSCLWSPSWSLSWSPSWSSPMAIKYLANKTEEPLLLFLTVKSSYGGAKRWLNKMLRIGQFFFST